MGRHLCGIIYFFLFFLKSAKSDKGKQLMKLFGYIDEESMFVAIEVNCWTTHVNQAVKLLTLVV